MRRRVSVVKSPSRSTWGVLCRSGGGAGVTCAAGSEFMSQR